ncbi:MAG: LacI family DNA-binding transcriptional regulator, partial [Tepidisphaeraceae bacterium]
MDVSGQALIAKDLRLSQATVSRALRNLPGIRPEVRARVISAAAAIGYVLPTGNGRVSDDQADEGFVGVMVHTPHQSWQRGGYLVGMSAVAPALNMTLVLHHVGTPDAASILDVQQQPPAMRKGLVKSLILVYRWPQDVVARLCERYRCVSLQHVYAGLPVDIIGADSARAMDELVGHLHSLGHRRIGFFGLCQTISWSRSRFAGYVDAMLRYELPLAMDAVVSLESAELEGYARQPERWQQSLGEVMAQHDAGVTAWVSSGDVLAYALISAFRSRGVSVPGDVSITGF